MTTTERHREGVVYRGLLLGMVVLIAISFAWLFYDQYQRSSDNQNLIARLAQDEAAGCKSGNDLRQTLKTLLLTIEDYPSPVPVTPSVLRAEQKLYGVLIAQIKFRHCE